MDGEASQQVRDFLNFENFANRRLITLKKGVRYCGIRPSFHANEVSMRSNVHQTLYK